MADLTLRSPEQVSGWNTAPSALGTLLALCEPPGWDLSPAQRLGRRNASANAIRLWSLIDLIATEPDCTLEEIKVRASPQLWCWQSWRHADGAVADPDFNIRIKFSTGELRFFMRVLHTPELLRSLKARRTWLDRFPHDQSALIWELSTNCVPMAYPQARAFLAALVFSTSPGLLDFGPREAHLPTDHA